MSAGSVIKYAMTLDGAQYMQELRRNIAATKAAEQAIRDESKAMGVIKVSQDEVKKALAASSAETGRFSGGMTSALNATRGFNAAQSALAQAMNGNFVGAAKSATSAANSFSSALAANPIILAAGILAGIAMGIKTVVDRMDEYRRRAGEIRSEHSAFMQELAVMEGTDPGSVARGKINSAADGGVGGVGEIRKQKQGIDSQVAAKKRELEEAEEYLRATQISQAKVAAVPGATWIAGDVFGKRAESIKTDIDSKKAEYQKLLDLQRLAGEAEAKAVKTTSDGGLKERDRQWQLKVERDNLAAAKTEEERNLIRQRLAQEKEFARRKEEDAAGSELGRLGVRKKNAQDDYAYFKSFGTAASDLKAQAALEKLYDTEQAITAEKKKQADQQRASAAKAAEEAAEKQKQAEKDRMTAAEKLAAQKKEDDAARAAMRAEEEGLSRSSGRTITGWHVNARSGEARRMEGSLGMLSGLNPSGFRKWSAKDGGPKEEMQKVEIGGEAVALLRGIDKKLA